MFVLEKVEFIEEIKAEMAGYEEMTPELIETWVKAFEGFVRRGNSKKIVKKGQNIDIKLEDEAELFRIVDRYLVAIENDEIEAYWQDWTL